MLNRPLLQGMLHTAQHAESPAGSIWKLEDAAVEAFDLEVSWRLSKELPG